VVRLKGGDPFTFGRGSEEQDACAAAGIRCRVVSGVTSAIAVPAAAGIPVTRRGVAQSFAVVTAEVAAGESSTFDWAEGVAGADTVVVLMGRTALARVASQLVAAGRPPETPVACVQSGTLPSQRVVRGTLATIAREVEEAGLSSPMVTVIGAVAALGNPRLAAALPAAGVAPC
jgi:uroporphyrinogen III methyltransferase/synthase